MILGAAYTTVDPAFALKLIIFPLMVRAVGVFASIIGAMCVRGKDDQNFNPMRPIQSGFVISAAVSTFGFGIINYYYLNHDWRFFFATFSGIILAIVIIFSPNTTRQRNTGRSRKPQTLQRPVL
jgi:K(+)-stimulated pyrophosphate-energized sodium pump